MGRIYSYDMMRGLAALAVMAYHAERLVPRGYLAVDLFFVLSGFVLYRNYASRLGTVHQFMSFTVRRIIRLYPLMFVGAALGLAINGGSLWTLLLIPTGESVLFPANIPLWSLLFELIASMLFAALFRYGRVIWLMIWISSGILLAVSIQTHGSADLGYRVETVPEGIFRVGYSFCSGIGAAYLVKSRPRISGWVLSFLFMPLAIFIWPVASPTLDVLSVLVVFPAVTVALSCYETGQRVLAAELGGLSYALYAIHHPLVKQAEGAGLLYVLLFLAILVLAWVLERYFDRPVRRVLTSRLSCETIPAS